MRRQTDEEEGELNSEYSEKFSLRSEGWGWSVDYNPYSWQQRWG